MASLPIKIINFRIMFPRAMNNKEKSMLATIKENKTYKVRGYDYDGKEIAKIEKIIITNRVYVKFYNNPKKYNYEILEFIPMKYNYKECNE